MRRTFRLFSVILFTQLSFGQNEKDRFILMADIGHDPDDEQQLVHLLAWVLWQD